MKYAFPENFYHGDRKKVEKLPLAEVKFFFACKGTLVSLLRPKLGGMVTCVLLRQKEDNR